MSGSSDTDVKFNIDGTYSRAEFVYRMEAIKALNPGDARLAASIDENVAWALGHSEDCIFSFTIRPDGVVVPIATVAFDPGPPNDYPG